MKFRSFAEGAGIAILLLATELLNPLSPNRVAIYHDPLPLSTVIGGLAIDLALACLLFTIFLVLLDSYDFRRTRLIWAIFLPLLAKDAVDIGAHFLKPRLTPLNVSLPWTPAIQLAFSIGVLAISLLLSIFFMGVFQRVVKVVKISLAVFGCCIFWVLPTLVYVAVRARVPATLSFSKPVEGSGSSARVIWILMDELSYDQVFDHRQPDVHLPHFDLLRRESVTFSNLQPAGYLTERVVPSLFLGRRITKIRSSFTRDLYFTESGLSGWRPFKEQESIFGDAKRAGWTTGVAGWFNPYCHILQNVLDTCYWQSWPQISEGLEEKSTIMDATTLPMGILRLTLGGSMSSEKGELSTDIEVYKELNTEAQSLIQNESIRFVFLHLPVPHPPGIYDRRTGKLRAGGTYLDNLALADKTLGDLLDRIQKTSVASHTTIILCSDHSWRVKMWDTDSSWTAEEERASGGKFDPRPVLMIRFPQSDTAELRSEQFPELALHAILQAMVQGKIQSQGELDAWLTQYERQGNPTLSGVARERAGHKSSISVQSGL